MSDSQISGLYKLSVPERIAVLEQQGFLSAKAARALIRGEQVLSASAADKIIENVVGVFSLPLAIAPNFIVNGRECIVPLVVEEPSIVAGLSSAAAMARACGGFTVAADASLLAGQIHIVDIADSDASMSALEAARERLLHEANEVHPRLIQRGGGVRNIELRLTQLQDGSALIVVDILVDTCDAMGANLVNTICEAIAPSVAEISGGNIALRILSNLADHSIVTATVKYPCSTLACAGMDGEQVRDRIVLANEIALIDPNRAATHNKGIMNGIDPLAIATGNDWRAIEAGAHAYAARSGRYAALTSWSVDDGDLLGELKIPLKVGIVGGTLGSNAAAKLGLEIAAVQSSQQLAELMAAVGLAQNFAALRALVTSGIQKGHMRMHARSVSSAVGAPAERLDEVVDQLVASGEIKDWKALEILATLDDVSVDDIAATATAAGKIILLGEHAVVYGHNALAIPILNAVRAAVLIADEETLLSVAEWGLHTVVDNNCTDGAGVAVNLIKRELNVADTHFSIRVSSALPRGMGLGSSAAIAVAITRAIAICQSIEITDADVNNIAFECEKLAHGTPSGIDNTISCLAIPMLFQNGEKLIGNAIHLAEPLPIVVGLSHQPGSTHEQVAGVRRRREKNSQSYDAIFKQINNLSIEATSALLKKDYGTLGHLMNTCHGLLNALQVSTPDLENMVAIARSSGALGAKLTGGGGGGAIVALCPGTESRVRSALHQAGYSTLQKSCFEDS
jgi:hydroxymethylglutaryl-CoA reductase